MLCRLWNFQVFPTGSFSRIFWKVMSKGKCRALSVRIYLVRVRFQEISQEYMLLNRKPNFPDFPGFSDFDVGRADTDGRVGNAGLVARPSRGTRQATKLACHTYRITTTENVERRHEVTSRTADSSEAIWSIAAGHFAIVILEIFLD